MNQSKDPGLTEEQFRQICTWLLIYAYVLLVIQILGVSLYFASIFIASSNEVEGPVFYIVAPLTYSLVLSFARQAFFKKQMVNGGVNGSVGYELSYRHNVFWWTGWCFVELMGAIAILVLSAKTIFGAG